ncbi:MAG: hypothetical protein ACP6IP_02190 [Candidatus Njordarchaeia archaeon]
MLDGTRLIQKTLRKLIKVVVPAHPIDIGRFSARMLMDILKENIDKLGLKFDDIIIHPGAQPRESADIELIKEGKIVTRISVKTSVSGEIIVTLRRLINSVRRGEDGIVVAAALFYKSEDEVDTKMIIIYLPNEILTMYNTNDIYDAIMEKIKEKTKREGYEKSEFLAINEALEIERTKLALEARDEAAEAKKLAMEARDEAAEAKNEAKKVGETLNAKIEAMMNILKKIEKNLRMIDTFSAHFF